MAMRVTGMYSGLDTDSIIQELVAARKTKVDTAVKAQKKLSWEQDAWKSLNTKLKSLQSKYISNMRFSSSYSKKTTKVSNDNAVSVITGEDAVNGVQSLEIKQLAKTGYLTGAKIAASDGSELTALSKISDIDPDFAGNGSITVKAGSKSVDIDITADTTISDVLTKIKDAGLNASFDANNQRFFISAKESGAGNDFSITASDANGAAALSAMGLQTDITSDEVTMAEYTKYAGYFVEGDRAATLANMKGLIDDTVSSRVNAYLEQHKSLVSSKEAAQEKIDEIKAKYNDTDNQLQSVDDYKALIEAKKEEIAGLDAGEAKTKAEEDLKALEEKLTDAEAVATQEANISKYDKEMEDIAKNAVITQGADGTYSAVATADFISEIENDYYAKASYAYDVKMGNATLEPSGATKISGQDAIIYLNNAEFTNTNNTFEINGLTFTALSETKEGESVTVTTEQDTDGIYDMVKEFLKEYNAVVNEMDKLYNADSAKGYEPLTDEEKEAMSETEIKEWEDKIKSSLLRRDENLSTVNSALQSIMSSGIEVNGETLYLHDFGIETLGYFNAPDNEKNAYHIDGDADDEYTSGNADKLKGLIASDPDKVISFFTQLSQNLYTKMSDLSKSVDGYRTYGNFYDDKKMKSDYTDYTNKIADLEEKLADYEDKWYSKFSAMETALAKMQSNSSAVTSLLGG